VRVAAIDIGTNTILLLVVDLPAGHVIEDRCRIERLGRGVDASGALDEAAVARSLDALREYATALRAAGAERVGAVGTQALREAKNGAAFLRPAQEILGHAIEVVGGEREAHLAFRAVRRSFPDLPDVVVCDVGGGSTELIVARGGSIESVASVKIGSVRLAERYLGADPPDATEAAAMIAAIDDVLAPLPLPAGLPLVATAGTATTLAAVSLGLAVYDAERVQGLRLPRSEVEKQVLRYLELPLAERRHIPGLDPRRADVIPAGAAIIVRVMERIGADQVMVSDRGIRWGLAYELAEAP
jgi:exopolyphosphatase / guanosine-5'-triphosphate,3'-diphosphate pyrophosphatase